MLSSASRRRNLLWGPHAPSRAVIGALAEHPSSVAAVSDRRTPIWGARAAGAFVPAAGRNTFRRIRVGTHILYQRSTCHGSVFGARPVKSLPWSSLPVGLEHVKPIRLSDHARRYASQRGFTLNEVEEAIRTASWGAAELGRLECRKDFGYGREWNGKVYAKKRVRPVFVEEAREIVVVTVYTYYFERL